LNNIFDETKTFVLKLISILQVKRHKVSIKLNYEYYFFEKKIEDIMLIVHNSVLDKIKLQIVNVIKVSVERN